jgi:hypothetical protein
MQAEGLEPELSEAAAAGRRATAELCRSSWTRAAADELLTTDLDPAHPAALTNLLICADSVVHLRRTHTWSARWHCALIVDTLTALTRPAP